MELRRYCDSTVEICIGSRYKESLSVKYRPGDRVRVKSWEEMLEEGTCISFSGVRVLRILGKFCFTCGMRRFCNKVVTIDSIADVCFESGDIGYYRIKEDKGMWLWSDSMFKEKVNE